jgi:hypothetical protein
MILRRITAGLVAVAAAAFAQTPDRKAAVRAYATPPDVADARYGPHERNVFDLWKAKTAKAAPLLLFIHGGGFMAGDKTDLPEPLRLKCLQAGIAVATINYRYSTIAPFPAPFEDSARALQYIRMRAREWNIDPTAVAASGGSAGAGISLWLAFHADMAQPASDDPVKRQSTRLSVAGVLNGQTAYDPRFIAKLINDETARHPALRQLFAVPPGEDVMTAAGKFALYEQASPVRLLSPDDPPIFLYYNRELQLPPPNPNDGIHSPKFGLDLKERMDKLGIECVVRTARDYGVNGAVPPAAMFDDMAAFFLRHFARGVGRGR